MMHACMHLDPPASDGLHAVCMYAWVQRDRIKKDFNFNQEGMCHIYDIFIEMDTCTYICFSARVFELFL